MTKAIIEDLPFNKKIGSVGKWRKKNANLSQHNQKATEISEMR